MRDDEIRKRKMKQIMLKIEDIKRTQKKKPKLNPKKINEKDSQNKSRVKKLNPLKVINYLKSKWRKENNLIPKVKLVLFIINIITMKIIKKMIEVIKKMKTKDTISQTFFIVQYFQG